MSGPEKTEKQKIWERVIRAPMHALLSRMRLLGFWPSNQELSSEPSEQAKERQQLEAKKAKLLQEALGKVDVEDALKKENQRRIEAARAKRKERAAERLKALVERRQAWALKKQKDVVYAGDEVSGGLGNKGSDEAELLSRNLPIVHDASDLARMLNVSLPVLRFLSFHRRGATIVHYHRYEIPKKTGGLRRISAPKPRLAAVQQAIWGKILKQLPVEAEAHGFVPQRSIVSNALPHTGHAVVVNLDLKDFFPSIGFKRVKGLFRSFGYSEQVAILLALLTTEPPRVPVQVDDKRLWIALGERALPQGACTSPSITNLICRRLDRRLSGLARLHEFAYTRYADDLTFSGNDRSRVGVLIAVVRRVLKEEGLVENEKKTRVMPKGRRQEVTGVVVNERVTVCRTDVRNLRALLHNVKKQGLASQNRENHPDFLAHLRGRIGFVRMVDPQKAAGLQKTFDEIASLQ